MSDGQGSARSFLDSVDRDVNERYREAVRARLREIVGVAVGVVDSVGPCADVKILNQRERGGTGEGAFVTVEVWVPASEIAGQS